uniref:Uncharacterized protein n=1 Tax=Glossina austeni TaxID=7395 RepID=A0A1A9UZX8_GLOAU
MGKVWRRKTRMFPQVLVPVRLPLSPQFFADRVAREELIRSPHQCRDLLDEAKDFHLMLERRGLVIVKKLPLPIFKNLTSKRSIPILLTRQRGEFISGQIYAVGGLASNEESVSTVEIYDPYKKRWRMGEQVSMKRSRVGVAVLDGKLCAFGGFNGSERLSTVEVYDPRKNILRFINTYIHS